MLRRAGLALKSAAPGSLRGVRAFHPILWGGAMFLKKATLWKAASDYGWPRIYRRLVEQTREHVPDPVQRANVNNAIAGAIRAPAEALTLVTDSSVYPVLEKIAKQGDVQAKKIMPPFVYALIRAGLEATAPVKYSAGVRSAVKRRGATKAKAKAQAKNRPPPPPPPPHARSFSSMRSQQEPLATFVRREVKIVLGLSVGTALLLYLYRELKPSDGGPDDLPAARYRHALLTRAVANKKQGNTRKAIACYEELLALEVARQHLLPLPAPGKEFTLELKILWQLGELHQKIGQTQRALTCFEEAAEKAARRPTLALESGTLYEKAGSCAQDQLLEVQERGDPDDMSRITELQARAETLYLASVKQLLPLDIATPIFSVAAELDEPGALRACVMGNSKKKLSLGEGLPPLVGHRGKLASLASGSLYNYASLLAATGRLRPARAVAQRSAVLGLLAGVEEETLEKAVALVEELDKPATW